MFSIHSIRRESIRREQGSRLGSVGEGPSLNGREHLLCPQKVKDSVSAGFGEKDQITSDGRDL